MLTILVRLVQEEMANVAISATPEAVVKKYASVKAPFLGMIDLDALTDSQVDWVYHALNLNVPNQNKRALLPLILGVNHVECQA